MSVQINANQFSLKYIPDEDRMVFCVTISAEHEIGTLLTRRLTRWLIDALIKHAPQAAQAVSVEDIVQPQSSNAPVDSAKDAKETKQAQEEKPRTLAVPPKLAREIKVAAKENGDIALVFNTGEQQIVLDIASPRILAVSEIFLDLAARAGWDFAGPAPRPIAPAPAETESSGKILH